MNPKKLKAPLLSRQTVPSAMQAGLAKAADLLAKKKLVEAINHLEALHRQFPKVAEPLMALTDVYQQAGDTENFARVLTALYALRPDDPDLTLALASVYLLEVHPALAVTTFREFLRRWPDHPDAAEARKTVATLLEDLAPRLAEMGLQSEGNADEALALAVLHERLQTLTEEGRYTEARRTAEQLLHKRPEFVPALNNLSLIYMMEGDLRRALATARRVLAINPQNYHALANEVRFLCQQGHFEEARSVAERLHEVQADTVDIWTKKAEAFSFLGDDEQVLAALAAAKKAGPDTQSAILYHLAAVAALRQGNVNLARRHWRQALKLSPTLEQAQQNLDDLQNPVGERHAPWAYDMWNWIPRRTIQELAEAIEKASRRGSPDEALRRTMQRFAGEHPELERLVPALLERSGPHSRTMALQLAKHLDTPPLRQALADFALGQRGPDALRMEAARMARDAGVLSSTTPVRLWIGGEWRELLLLEFEVYEEPDESHHSEQVAEMAQSAFDALQENRYAEGEALLRQALALEPDSPDLMNNLASALSMQDRPDESYQLLTEIHERFPDYLFGRTNLATHAVLAGDLERAHEFLDPVIKQGRFHHSEFSALCMAQIALLVAEDKIEGASQWLDIWKSLVGDHPQQEYWSNRLLLERMKNFDFGSLGRGKRGKRTR